MKRILVIDASTESQNQVLNAMGPKFEIVVVSNGGDAKKKLGREAFDIILLEVDLPDGDGFSLCSKVKNHEVLKWIPIIFLTERNTVSDKIQGFKVGADDYMSKPFDSYELLLRVEARLRSQTSYFEQNPDIQKGDLKLSVQFQRAFLDDSGLDKDLKLTPTEFRLLYFFMKNEGSVLARNQFIAMVWGDDVQVLSRTIDKHISTLKKKLGARAEYIQSVHSRGYRFSREENDILESITASAPL